MSAKVLIIDDDNQLCRMMDQLLTRNGFQVSVAYDGEEGLRQSHSDQFDLVITDLVMPKVNGLDVICEIKREQPHAKIIAISGGDYSWKEGKETYLQVANKLGAKRCFAKPFDPENFIEAVSGVMKEDTGLH